MTTATSASIPLFWNIPPLGELAMRCTLALMRHPQIAARIPKGKSTSAPITARTEALDADRLAEALHSLGVPQGSVLMVHSSSDALTRWGWDASKAIDSLLNYIGNEGTLAMPTHARLKQVGDSLVYDINRSPSTVGLITEIFRRRKTTVRSACPFSPVSACGPQALSLVSDHQYSQFPHDEHSPYAKLAEVNGWVVCLGAPLETMTILHVAEDVMRLSTSVPGFHIPTKCIIRNNDEERHVEVQRRADWLWWYISKLRWQREMLAQGLTRRIDLAGCTLWAAPAKEVIEWMCSQIKSGDSIYPLAHWNRFLRLRTPKFIGDARSFT